MAAASFLLDQTTTYIDNTNAAQSTDLITDIIKSSQVHSPLAVDPFGVSATSIDSHQETSVGEVKESSSAAGQTTVGESRDGADPHDSTTLSSHTKKESTSGSSAQHSAIANDVGPHPETLMSGQTTTAQPGSVQVGVLESLIQVAQGQTVSAAGTMTAPEVSKSTSLPITTSITGVVTAAHISSPSEQLGDIGASTDSGSPSALVSSFAGDGEILAESSAVDRTHTLEYVATALRPFTSTLSAIDGMAVVDVGSDHIEGATYSVTGSPASFSLIENWRTSDGTVVVQTSTTHSAEPGRSPAIGTSTVSDGRVFVASSGIDSPSKISDESTDGVTAPKPSPTGVQVSTTAETSMSAAQSPISSSSSTGQSGADASLRVSGNWMAASTVIAIWLFALG